MDLKKLTTILIVDRIEPCLGQWQSLGYSVVARVPDEGSAGFVLLHGASGDLMLQTRESLAEDLPDIAARKPQTLLYADVASLDAAKKSLRDARVVVAHRKTFYGADEAWVELAGGVFLGLSVHSG
jgi:hypothetical protein